MTNNYKRFVEKYLPTQDESLFKNELVVAYTQLPVSGRGIYMIDRIDYTPLFTLDEEDKLYLYNKYKSKASEQIEEEKRKLLESKTKELVEIRTKLKEKERELDNLVKN